MTSSDDTHAFYADYARTRGLTGPFDSGSFDIGHTPLLGKGDNNYWNHLMPGTLPGGIQGVLGRFTIETQTSSQDHTVATWSCAAAVTRVPFAQGWPSLYCHRHRRAGGLLSHSPDSEIEEPTRRIEFESEKFDHMFEILISERDDGSRVRRLFDPVLIDSLSGQASTGFCFEAYNGVLAGYSDKLEDGTDPTELDGLCEATAIVAKRLAEESQESAPPPVALSMAAILETGRPAHAVVLTTFEADVRPEDSDLLLLGFVLDVTPDFGEEPFQTRLIHRIPPELVPRAIPGAQLIVKYLFGDPDGVVAIDWPASSL